MKALARAVTISLVCLSAGAVSAVAQGDGDPVAVNCSECQTCPIDPELTFFRYFIAILEPGEEMEGPYVLGNLTGYEWQCQDSYSCDGDLIPCRGPYNAPTPEDLSLAAQALSMTVEDASVYLKRAGATIVHVPSRNAIQLVGCGGGLIAHLPVGQQRTTD